MAIEKFSVWGVNACLGSTIGSYIKSEGAHATRQLDTVSEVRDLRNRINSQEGAIEITLSTKQDNTDNKITLSDGLVIYNQLVYKSLGNSIEISFTSATGTDFTHSISVTPEVMNTIGVTWGSKNRILLNGSVVFERINTVSGDGAWSPNTIDQLNFSNHNGFSQSNEWEGKIESLRLYDTESDI